MPLFVVTLRPSIEMVFGAGTKAEAAERAKDIYYHAQISQATRQLEVEVDEILEGETGGESTELARPIGWREV